MGVSAAFRGLRVVYAMRALQHSICLLSKALFVLGLRMKNLEMSVDQLISLGRGIPVFDELIETLRSDDGTELECIEIAYNDIDLYDD